MSLVKSGSAGRYFVYAIGEIALVVIGILIALQVNNWNEYRKDQKEEQSYLIRLLNELQLDSNSLEGSLLLSRFKADGARSNLDQMTGTSASGIDTSSFVTQAFLIGVLVIFRPELTTYEDLVSSGKFNLLQSDQLKSALIGYMRRFRLLESRVYPDMEDQWKAYNNHMHHYFSTLISEEIGRVLRETNEWNVPVDQLKKAGLDMAGYMADPNSLYHLRNIVKGHQQNVGAYEENLNNMLKPLIEMVREEIN